MSAERTPHSRVDLIADIERGIRSTGDTNIGSAARYQARAALRDLEEQFEALREENAKLRSGDRNFKATVDALSEAVAQRDERLAAYEEPGWINSVQKVMEYRQALRETWDDYAVAIDEHASEEVRTEARHSMLKRFSAYEEQGWLSNPAKRPM